MTLDKKKAAAKCFDLRKNLIYGHIQERNSFVIWGLPVKKSFVKKREIIYRHKKLTYRKKKDKLLKKKRLLPG